MQRREPGNYLYTHSVNSSTCLLVPGPGPSKRMGNHLRSETSACPKQSTAVQAQPSSAQECQHKRSDSEAAAPLQTLRTRMPSLSRVRRDCAQHPPRLVGKPPLPGSLPTLTEGDHRNPPTSKKLSAHTPRGARTGRPAPQTAVGNCHHHHLSSTRTSFGLRAILCPPCHCRKQG